MPFELKYLFWVRYKDGSDFLQSPDDISAVDSKRSAFFDILQENVELFALEGEGHRYLVDLRDGHFEADGAPLYVGVCPKLWGPMPRHHEDEHGVWGPLRLIYFRRNREYLVTSMGGVFTPTGKHMEFHFGWQGLGPDGKNYQQTLILV